VAEYTEQVRKAGNFSLPRTAVVLHPEMAATHFHLIYLTRDPKGIEVFMAAERTAMQQMEATRARAQQKRRVEKSRQPEFFADEEGEPSAHYVKLRERCLAAARDEAWEHLKAKERVRYDHLWANALRLPLVWEKDIKEWIAEWRKSGLITVEGMAPKQRVPKRGAGIVIRKAG
ncbi:MAG: hypothetical protein KY476_12765, partial [Planctomycetes bacterium]|nr:hypothetical protein [Planctomycetota bacterium]